MLYVYTIPAGMDSKKILTILVDLNVDKSLFIKSSPSLSQQMARLENVADIRTGQKVSL